MCTRRCSAKAASAAAARASSRPGGSAYLSRITPFGKLPHAVGIERVALVQNVATEKALRGDSRVRHGCMMCVCVQW